MLKALKYRLYINKATEQKLEWVQGAASCIPQPCKSAGKPIRMRARREAATSRNVTWWRSKSRDRYDSVTYPDAAGWQLKIKQQALKHKKKRSKRRKKAARLVGKVHRKVTNCRRDFLHKQSRILVDTYDTLVFEDLSPSNLSRRPRAIQGEDGTYLPNGASARLGRSLQQTRS